jgi:hypothetical protein
MIVILIIWLSYCLFKSKVFLDMTYQSDQYHKASHISILDLKFMIEKVFWDGGMAYMVEYLPSKHWAQNSNPITAKKIL